MEAEETANVSSEMASDKYPNLPLVKVSDESTDSPEKGTIDGEWAGPRINLAQLAQNHVVFLKTVHEIPSLHKPDFIRNAIRRYEYMWLQIASKYNRVELEPPIDIHWVWHVHMLAPRAYGIDCQNVSGTVVDHKFRITKNDINTARANTIAIWKDWFPDEPYDIDFNVPLSEKDLAHKPTMIRYDILSAAGRQRSFYYHVSLPHFTDAKFLNTAADRYVQFLKMKKDHPEAFLGMLSLFILFCHWPILINIHGKNNRLFSLSYPILKSLIPKIGALFWINYGFISTFSCRSIVYKYCLIFRICLWRHSLLSMGMQ